MFWFRAVVQFLNKFHSHPQLLSISTTQSDFTAHGLNSVRRNLSWILCFRCAPNALQLLTGTQGLEQISTLDIFKPHGWGLSLQGTKLYPAQSNPCTTSADNAASAPSALVCSLLLLHLVAFWCQQPEWTV